MAEVQEYAVRLTGLPSTEQYSDIALTGLFAAHTAIINSERQAIWQRYNVMLIANAVIFGFFAGGVRTVPEMVFGVIFGLMLCVIWWVITREGWTLLTTRRNRAAQFSWSGLDPEANPFQIGLVYEGGITGGWIYIMAMAVIYLFGAAYLFLAMSRFILKP